MNNRSGTNSANEISQCPPSAKFRVCVRAGPPITSLPDLGAPALSVTTAPQSHGLENASEVHQSLRSTSSSLYLRGNPAYACSLAPPTHQLPSNPKGGMNRRYGGAIVRVSELKRRGDGVLLASSFFSAESSSASSPAPRSVVGVGDSRTPLASVASGVLQQPIRAVSPCLNGITESLALAATRPTRQTLCWQKTGRALSPGLSASRKTSVKATTRRRSPSTLALQGDGHPYEFRWFTARGRRQLIYNGKTYSGKKAHRMWADLKRAKFGLAPAATRLRTETSRARRAALSIPHESEESQQTVTPQTLPIGSLPLTSEWKHLFKDIDLDEESIADEEHRLDSKGPASLLPKPAPPAKHLAIKLPIPRSGGVTPARPLGGASASSKAPTKVVETIDDDEDDVVEENKCPDRKGGRMESTRAEAIVLLRTHRTHGDRPQADTAAPSVRPPRSGSQPFTDWPESYFTSSSDYTTDDESDHDHGLSTMDQNKSDCKPTVLIPTQDSEATLSRTNASTSRFNYQGVDVVEHDGWLYPVELLRSLQPEGKNTDDNGFSSQGFPTHQNVPTSRSLKGSCEGNDSSRLILDRSNRQADRGREEVRGLTVIGAPILHRTTPPGTLLPDPPQVLTPVFDRYDETGFSFESLTPNEVTDLMDVTEEIGGFRFSM